MRKNFFTLSLGDLVTILVVIFMSGLFYSCADTQEEINKKRPVTTSEEVDSADIAEIITEPVVPETHEVPVNLNAWTTYWYVTFDVHIQKSDSRYNGYDIITLETTYFDLEQAMKKIVPDYVEKDYIGITFFQQVPVETYKAYEKSKL